VGVAVPKTDNIKFISVSLGPKIPNAAMPAPDAIVPRITTIDSSKVVEISNKLIKIVCTDFIFDMI
jgi:hypothetical protein